MTFIGTDDHIVERQILAKQVKQMVVDKHRQKLVNPIDFMGLVTKTLKKSDKEFNSGGAKAAVHAELSKLMLAKVWDSKPISRHEAAKKHPNATFSRIFGILGLKDSEASASKFKYRIVVQGSSS